MKITDRVRKAPQFFDQLLPDRFAFSAASGPAFKTTVVANKSEPIANKSDEPANKSKRGRPIKQTGDPAKDKRNAEQRELMRKRRAAK